MSLIEEFESPSDEKAGLIKIVDEHKPAKG
jgi:hypothetical protein